MNIDAAAARYLPQGKMAHGFARGKMGGDPVYASVLGFIESGHTVLDVGCGEGYLLALVRENRAGVQLFGVDHDERRVASGQQALGDAASLWVGDVREAELPAVDVVTCLDVLHYQTPAEQDAILARLVAALRPGGVLLVRDGTSDSGLRSVATTFSERVAVALGRHKGDGVYFRPRGALADALMALGLSVEQADCAEGTPFANVLTVGRRA